MNTNQTNRKWKSNMAAPKPEMSVSQLPDEIETKFRQLTYIFANQQFNEISANTVRTHWMCGETRW